MPAKHVLIADDHRLIRGAMRTFIQSILSEGATIREAGDGFEALSLIALHPEIQVLIVDVRMPKMDGLMLLERLHGREHGVNSLVVSQYDQEVIVNKAFDLGAKGFLSKSDSLDDFEKAIELVALGEYYVNDLLIQWQNYAPDKSVRPMDVELSPREHEMFYYLKQGKSSKEIANVLNLSVMTIESYRKNMMKRTQTKNVAELISFVLESGLFLNHSRH